MAFDGVLTPESASIARQAAISKPLACQSTPETHSWTDSPLRERRSRGLWGIRNGQLAQWWQ